MEAVSTDIRIYREEVQNAVDRVVEMAEQAESNLTLWPLSSWYGSICTWIRRREEVSMGFTLTLPDPETGGEPLTIIEVRGPTHRRSK